MLVNKCACLNNTNGIRRLYEHCIHLINSLVVPFRRCLIRRANSNNRRVGEALRIEIVQRSVVVIILFIRYDASRHLLSSNRLREHERNAG